MSIPSPAARFWHSYMGGYDCRLKCRFDCLICVGLVSGILSTASQAASPSSSEILEEVIVVAQRREQSLQRVPLSVTAFARQQLEELAIANIGDSANFAPNLHIVPAIGGSINALVSIRGAATRVNNLSRDTSVGVYLDGVPIAKTAGALFEITDLARIEVLRGPQGTLYGKNTIGGAMNLISQAPAEKLGGNMTLGLGRDQLYTFRGNLDTGSWGASDQFSSRLSYFKRQRDGLYGNSGTSQRDFEDVDKQGMRLAQHWQVSERLSLDYSFDDFRQRQQMPMLQLTDVSLGGATGAALAAIASHERQSSIANDSAYLSDADISGHSLTLHYQLPDSDLWGQSSLKSISAKRDTETRSQSDFDGSNLDLFRFINDNNFTQLTQELQWLGSTDQLDYVLGAFYYEDDWDTFNPRWLFKFGGSSFDTDNRSGEGESRALYGQLSWTPVGLKQLTLSAGLRHTQEDKSVLRLRQGASSPSPEIDNLRQSGSWSKTTHLLAAQWQQTENLMYYSKLSSGFKSGGYNGVATTAAQFATPFAPENLNAYEAGVKSRWLEQRLQINAAAFYNDYEDLQVDTFVPTALGIAVNNAGEAVMSGVELEIQTRPSADWDIYFNYGYLHTEYKKFEETDGMGNTVDLSDERYFAYSPRHSYSIGSRYQWTLLDQATLMARLDYSWKDDHHISDKNVETTDVGHYGLWSARMTLQAKAQFADSGYSVSLWGKNLTDEAYHVTGSNLSVMTVTQWGEARSFGVELQLQF